MDTTNNILKIQPPVSLGLLMSYRCNTACRYCIYASSPEWESNWLKEEDAELIFSHLKRIFNEVYPGTSYTSVRDNVSFSYGLHFTGGEPFLNYKLLLKLTELAKKTDLPATFVETNCFWARDDSATEEKMIELKKAGLGGILISVNPFTVESIPFERIDRAVRIGDKFFGSNLIVYQNFYLSLFREMKLKGKLSFEDFLKKIELQNFYNHIELLPMGRTPYRLGDLFQKYPAKSYLTQNCYSEMTRNWHTHIDNYCNYIPGFCAGISLGDFREYDSLFSSGVDLKNKPVINALITNLAELIDLGKQFGFKENSDGYISKCHLCTEIRKHIISRTSEFDELSPVQFYKNINSG
jgi:MoaA/NifB/PqqE/SkfB family radical SAM enzyme